MTSKTSSIKSAVARSKQMRTPKLSQRQFKLAPDQMRQNHRANHEAIQDNLPESPDDESSLWLEDFFRKTVYPRFFMPRRRDDAPLETLPTEILLMIIDNLPATGIRNLLQISRTMQSAIAQHLSYLLQHREAAECSRLRNDFAELKKDNLNIFSAAQNYAQARNLPGRVEFDGNRTYALNFENPTWRPQFVEDYARLHGLSSLRVSHLLECLEHIYRLSQHGMPVYIPPDTDLDDPDLEQLNEGGLVVWRWNVIQFLDDNFDRKSVIQLFNRAATEDIFKIPEKLPRPISATPASMRWHWTVSSSHLRGIFADIPDLAGKYRYCFETGDVEVGKAVQSICRARNPETKLELSALMRVALLESVRICSPFGWASGS